jgi:hypothetical protein
MSGSATAENFYMLLRYHQDVCAQRKLAHPILHGSDRPFSEADRLSVALCAVPALAGTMHSALADVEILQAKEKTSSVVRHSRGGGWSTRLAAVLGFLRILIPRL